MKNYVLAGVVVVVTVLGVSFVGKPNVTVSTPTPVVNVSVPEQKTPVVNIQAPDVKVPATVVNVPETKLGAVSGPDWYNPYFNQNNVFTYPIGKKILNATTTPCSLRTPTEATSTLVRAWFNVTSGTTTAATLVIATSTTAFATTTPLISPITGLTNKYSFVYTGTTTNATNGGSVSGNVFSPGSWLVFGLAGQPTLASGGWVIGGTCGAVFQGL